MKKSTCLSLLLIFLALQLRAQTCDTVPFLNTYWANGLQEYSVQNIFPGRNGETWLIGNTVVQPYTVNAADRIFVTKLNARGFPLTTFMLGIQGNITLGSAAQTAEGGFLIVGQAIENGLIYGEAILAKIDTAGHTIWSYGLGKQPSSFANVTPHPMGVPP